jgi:hypothetical protein
MKSNLAELRAGVALALTLAMCAPACAQPAQGQSPIAPPQTLEPKPCSDPATEARRNSNPRNDPRTDGAGQSLSDKLDNSNGVLCPPPEVDPSIKAPSGSTGDRSVVPPPGTPGGDPTVRPK